VKLNLNIFDWFSFYMRTDNLWPYMEFRFLKIFTISKSPGEISFTFQYPISRFKNWYCLSWNPFKFDIFKSRW
jgi:hypothetical protein